MKTPHDVETYLASVPEPERAALGRLRSTIQEVVPDAEEVISYQVPTFRYHGPLVAYSASKTFASLHLMSVAVKKAHEAEIAPYETTVATIHFLYARPLPVDLVKNLVRARVEENLAREARPRKRVPAPRRTRNPMPDEILAALRESGLAGAYESRPSYQQNDYLGWIGQAKRGETKAKRIAQMLDELRAGNVYMKMNWNPRPRE